VGHRYAPIVPEVRLAQPADPTWASAASAFPVRSHLPFELVYPCGKRFAVRRHEPGLLAKLASIYMHQYGSDNLVKGGSGIDLVIR